MDNYIQPWDKLSLKDKADMMKVAINNGITSLSEIKEAYNKYAENNEYAGGGPLKQWTMEDEAGYRKWRSNLPKNLRNTNDNDYDMRGAYKAGMQPEWNGGDNSYHLGSRDPQTGRILKAPHHPTYLEAIAIDANMGYFPVIDRDGNTYTNTWRGNEKVQEMLNRGPIRVPYNSNDEYAEGGNLFGKGGRRRRKVRPVAEDANYRKVVSLYTGYINKGLSPETALELTNQNILEGGWNVWKSGDNKRYKDADSLVNHVVDWHGRMYPKTLDIKNFNEFFNGLQNGIHKYNPNDKVYRTELLNTRNDVLRRVNHYRKKQGQPDLSLLDNSVLPMEDTTTPTNILMPTYNQDNYLTLEENNLPVNMEEPQTVNNYNNSIEPNPLMQENITAYGGNLFADGGYLTENLFANGGNTKKKKRRTFNANTSRAINYLKSKGMSDIGARAIVGTLYAESGMNPAIHAQMKGDTGEGLAQWTGSRKKVFWKTLESIEPGAQRKYKQVVNVPLERQLDVVLAERPEVMSAINNAKDLRTATDIMLRGFENGGGRVNNMASKQQMDAIYGKWNNKYDNQMRVRLGFASDMFGLPQDPNQYGLSQEWIDTTDNMIKNIPQVPMIKEDPALSYKPPVIDMTAFQKPEVKEETPMFDPNEERKERLNNFNTMLGLMGQQSPFAAIGTNDSPQGIMAIVNGIYNNKYDEGGQINNNQKTVYKDGEEYYVLDENSNKIPLKRYGDFGIESEPSTWQFSDSNGLIYSPHGTSYSKVPKARCFNEKGLEIVSPEFDILTMAPLIRDAFIYGVKKLPKIKVSNSAQKEPDLVWDAEQMMKDGNNYSYTQKDLDILNKHIREYKKIEKKTKANGTYLKMPDGSKWKGDPRIWVIAQSKK